MSFILNPRSLFLYLGMVSCSEYDIKNQEEVPQSVDTSETETETFIAPDCAVSLPDIGTVEIDEECLTPEYNIQNPWNVEIEWQWSGLGDEPTVDQIMVAPIVGNLTDDNGDGRIDESDTPDIVVVIFDSMDGSDGDLGSWVDARLVAIDGQSGRIHWQRENVYWKGTPAIADINGDGYAEIVATNDQKRPIAVRGATGEDLWEANVYLDNAYPTITVADINADGTAEVIADNAVINGRTGQLLHQFTVDPLFIGRMPAVGDLDQDGSQEIIIANKCYNSDVSLRWSSSIQGDYGHWSAILNADDDLDGEVAMVGAGWLGIYDPDGTELFKTNAGTGQPGPPCVADFDGDDVAEIAWASSSQFNMFELDGTLLWTQTITDASGLAGCSGYDVNGDGAYEVLFADENTFWLFDGSTGGVLFSQLGHASGTIFEYPIVADIDGDDSAEIVISSNNFRMNGQGWAGITVFGHLGDGWAKSGSTWNVHDFAVTNIYTNGGVPLSPEPSWQTYNVYRSRPTEDAMTVDLLAEITDICFAGCDSDSRVRLSVQPMNQGPSSIRSGIPIALYRKDGASYTFITTGQTADRLEAGQRGLAVEFETEYGRIEGAEALVARADDWGTGFGTIYECDEWNNGIEFTELTCIPTPINSEQ